MNPDVFTQGQPTERQVREAIAAYYACISFVDDNVGLILDALDRTGLAERHDRRLFGRPRLPSG